MLSSLRVFRKQALSFTRHGRALAFRCRQPTRQTVRWQSSGANGKAAAELAKTKKLAFPQRLLVYHAGTGRTVFVGCTKVSTFFVLGYFCSVLAPAYFYAPDEPAWMVPIIIAAGAIPVLFVAYTTKPFVTYVHLVLPERARASREALGRWVNAAGRDVQLDFTTMRTVGLSRTTRLRMADLRRRPEGSTDISNITLHSAGSAWRTPVRSVFGVPRRFHVSAGVNHSNEPALWRALHDRILEDGGKAKVKAKG